MNVNEFTNAMRAVDRALTTHCGNDAAAKGRVLGTLANQYAHETLDSGRPPFIPPEGSDEEVTEDPVTGQELPV